MARVTCGQSHCQASVTPVIAHLLRDDPPPTWEETSGIFPKMSSDGLDDRVHRSGPRLKRDVEAPSFDRIERETRRSLWPIQLIHPIPSRAREDRRKVLSAPRSPRRCTNSASPVPGESGAILARKELAFTPATETHLHGPSRRATAMADRARQSTNGPISH
jgi:hypothetical protein